MVTNRISPFIGHYQERQPPSAIVERLVDFLCELDDLTFDRIVQLATQLSKATVGSRIGYAPGQRIKVDDWVIPLRKGVAFNLGQVVECAEQQQILVRWYRSQQDTFEDADRLVAGHELIQAVRLAITRRPPMQTSQATTTGSVDDQSLSDWRVELFVNLRQIGRGLQQLSLGLGQMLLGLFQMTFGIAFGAMIGLGQDLFEMAFYPFRGNMPRRDVGSQVERRWN